jgi:anti-sigma regulatory factor (Ser/Thr protein kinase)
MKKSFECQATIENLVNIMAFVEGELEAMDCALKQQVQITVAVEEIFVNIAHYAYAKLDENQKPIPDTGTGPMTLYFESKDGKVYLTFEDAGIPYNPLEKEDPDVTMSAEDREIGGLGIFMVKKSMDEVKYKHEKGKNLLTLVKTI